ncbi:MAG: CbiQ family ECF transporter T component [Pseudonocardiaceae bacterium]
MRAVHRISYSRALHPGAWWLWALGLAAAASRTKNPVPLVLIIAVTGLVVAARRTDAPWARAYRAFLKLALLVIAIRIVLQALLSEGAQGVTVLFTLPEVPMPDSFAGVKLGGDVTAEAVLTAFYDGLQLATILVCMGAANSLASARRLLRCVPGALYEVGVATVVALTFAPQLVTDAARVRSAHRLRGHSGGGIAMFTRTAMPVVEGALERSVELAAAMDSRGYGRTTASSRGSRRWTAALTFGGLIGVCIGVYGLLDGSASPLLGVPSLLVGAALAGAGLGLGSRRTRRTRYRPDPWSLPEWLVTGSGMAAAVALFATATLDPATLVLAGPLVVPEVPWLALAGILLAAAPAVVAPPPPAYAAAIPADRPRPTEVAA